MRTFAIVYGLVFLAIGILGFFPGLLSPIMPDHPPLVLEGGYGLLFGLFPVNWVHNIVHIVFGIWGLGAAGRWGAARAYARAVAIIYAILMVMGLFPVLWTTFGLVPLFGNDIWLHAVLAVVAAYFGWGVRRPVDEPARTATVHR